MRKVLKKCLSILLVMILFIPSNMLFVTERVEAAEIGITANDYEISYGIDSTWDGAFNAHISIKNVSSNTIEGWRLEVEMLQNITNIWNAEIISEYDGIYLLGNCNYNQNIKPGETVCIGYTASGDSLVKPDEIKLVTRNKETVLTESLCNVKFDIYSDWKSGFSGAITLTNISDEEISNWSIEFDMGGIIESLWNGIILESENNHYVVKNDTYNGKVNSGESVTVGINVSGDNLLYPQNFVVKTLDFGVKEQTYTVKFVCEGENITNIPVTQFITEGQRIETPIIPVREGYSFEGWYTDLSYNTEYDFTSTVTNDITLYALWTLINDEVVEDEIDYISDENVIFSDYSLEVGVETKITVSAQVLCDENDEIHFYAEKNNEWMHLGSLYDDGNLYLDNDEISNDGIYTNCFEVFNDVAGNINFKISCLRDGLEIDYVVKEIDFYENYDDSELILYLSDCELIDDCINDFYSTNQYNYGDAEEVIEFMKNHCETVLPIIDYEKIDGNTIRITFDNGLEYYIAIDDSTDLINMSRGFGKAGQIIQTGPVEVDLTLSNGIYYWAPFDTAWSTTDETDELLAIIEEAGATDLLTFFADEQANIEALKEIEKNGLVILATHGISGEWIATGERAYTSSIIKYKKEISNKQVGIQSIYDVSTKKSTTFLAVSPKWFSNNIQQLPKSIVINNSCYSMTDNWMNVFLGKGAGTYFGNNGKVSNEYATEACINLVTEIIYNENITGYSFGTSLDSYYDEGASFLGKGQGNLALGKNTSYIGFEDGISSWNVKGDCRVLNKIGSIQSVEGNYMAMISTGVGYTMSGGAISKSIYIPENTEEMMISWNFISAEFLEYINTSYDDAFYISITDGNETDIIFSKTVNSVAKDFDAGQGVAGRLKSVPEIVLNDCGDIWMTDWQESYIDISKYSGKNVLIKFSADNTADTALPSAMLIDNIHFDGEQSGTDMYMDVDEFVRWGNSQINTTGKSYIFYVDEFSSQAKKMQKTIKSNNQYKNKSQVVMYQISTEAEFVEKWNGMTVGTGNSIDTVAILMHGNYYAIIIDADNKENLVVDSEGLAGSDGSATPIGSLNSKNINQLELYSCNAGLLDAIDCNITKQCNEGSNKGKNYEIKNNVAVEFAKLGGIEYIFAYDGSVGFGIISKVPRLSHAQNHYFDFLAEISPTSNVTVKRFAGKIKDVADLKCSDNKPYYSLTNAAPNGLTLYSPTNDVAVYKYREDTVKTNSFLGIKYKTTTTVYKFDYIFY